MTLRLSIRMISPVPSSALTPELLLLKYSTGVRGCETPGASRKDHACRIG